jgi:two-component system NtrC family sensor kinase
MLRLAQTVADPSGQTAGIVIVNIAADELIAVAARVASSRSEGLQLLNEEGYLLAGTPPARLWGFMFGRHDSLATANATLWARIRASASGSVDAADLRYVYQSVRRTAFSLAGEQPGTIRPTAVRWTIVGTVPAVSVTTVWSNVPPLATVLGLLFIAGICLAWSRATILRQIADEHQKAAERELVRVERLASLGGLVAGVAHELNTPIGNAVTLASTLAGLAQELSAKLEADQIKRSTLSSYIADMREGTFILQHLRAESALRLALPVFLVETQAPRGALRVLAGSGPGVSVLYSCAGGRCAETRCVGFSHVIRSRVRMPVPTPSD